jgi:hypothetical protein
MDTSAQAAKNPKAFTVRMTTCRVQILGAGNATYLYQEQALADSLDKPYRQRLDFVGGGGETFNFRF